MVQEEKKEKARVKKLQEWVKNTGIKYGGRIWWENWIEDGTYREVARDLGVDEEEFKDLLLEAQKYNYGLKMFERILEERLISKKGEGEV
jgi:hypothetical protein